MTPEAQVIETAGELAALIEGWAMINGHPVLIGDSTGGSRPAGQSSTISKAEIAKLAHAGGDKHHQIIAEQAEVEMADALKMDRTPDNSPFDLINSKNSIEVKTLVSNTNDKITMSKEAVALKQKYEKDYGLKPYTLVVDKRPEGMGKGINKSGSGVAPSTGQTRYFIRSGYGSFTLGSMTEVKMSQIKSFMSAGK